MFLFWSFGMTVGWPSHFQTMDFTHYIYVILHFLFLTTHFHFIGGQFWGLCHLLSELLQQPPGWIPFTILYPIIIFHQKQSDDVTSLFWTLAPFSSWTSGHILSKTYKGLQSLNPTFLFCFYQSTHTTVHWPLVLLDLSGLFAFFAFAQAISSAWNAFPAFPVCRTPSTVSLRPRSHYSSQLETSL